MFAGHSVCIVIWLYELLLIVATIKLRMCLFVCLNMFPSISLYRPPFSIIYLFTRFTVTDYLFRRSRIYFVIRFDVRRHYIKRCFLVIS